MGVVVLHGTVYSVIVGVAALDLVEAVFARILLAIKRGIVASDVQRGVGVSRRERLQCARVGSMRSVCPVSMGGGASGHAASDAGPSVRRST